MRFAVDYTYYIPEYGTAEFDADDAQQAEYQALNYVKDTFSDVANVDVTEVREIS